jgi:Flp pilus assembly protein TadD
MKKILITILFLFMSVALFASYEDALKLYQEGKYKESLSILANELDISKDLAEEAPNYNIRFLAAHNHWKLGNDESAAIHFKRCMDMKNKSIDPYVDLSLFYLQRNKLNDAEAYAKKGLQRERNAMLYYILGEASLKRENFWRAKELFETANSIDPENFVSYNALGIVLMRIGKYGDANVAFSVALAINPSSPEIMNNMGMSLEKLGENKEALAHYKKANELDMENKTILANLKRLSGSN